MLEGVFGLNLLVDIAEADGLRRQLLCSWRRHDGTGVGIVEERLEEIRDRRNRASCTLSPGRFRSILGQVWSADDPEAH